MWPCEIDKGRTRRLLFVISPVKRPMPVLTTTTTTTFDRKSQWKQRRNGYHLKKATVDQQNQFKLTLKKLIVNCSHLFRRYEDAANVEKRKTVGNQVGRREQTAPQPFILLENICAVASPTKNQFLDYFRLSPSTKMMLAPELLSSGQRAPQPVVKLSQCTNIPFSSDVGRKMAERENHRLADEVKLKRLERSEWYINKTNNNTITKPEETIISDDGHEVETLKDAHVFKPPKRQNHQHNPSLHDSTFLMQFCSPVKVKLERFDLRSTISRQPVVLIRKSEKIRCDSINKRKPHRTKKP